MAVTYRTQKGYALTKQEFDANFQQILNGPVFDGYVRISGSVNVSGSNTFINTGPMQQTGNMFISGSISGKYIGTTNANSGWQIPLWFTGSNNANDLTVVLGDTYGTVIKLEAPSNVPLFTKINLEVIAPSSSAYFIDAKEERIYFGNGGSTPAVPFIPYWDGATTSQNINENSLKGVRIVGTPLWIIQSSQPFIGFALTGSNSFEITCIPKNLFETSSLSRNAELRQLWAVRIIEREEYVP